MARDLYDPKELEMMKVEKLMSKDVKSCWTDQTLADAARLMWERDCGCVPITEEGEHLVGIITDRDVCMAAYFTGKPLHDVSIRESMSPKVLACRPDDSVDTAEALMRQAQIRRLPVTDDRGKLVGILSLTDIAREATRTRAKKTPEIGLNDVALTLGAVCEQRVAPAPPVA